MSDFQAARHNMVESQVRPSGIVDQDIMEAMSRIPREQFVPSEKRSIAYHDRGLEIARTESGPRTLMEPRVTGKLADLAKIEKSHVALVVGAGTGYSSAVIGQLADTVVALEVDEGLAAMATETLAAQGADNVAVVSGVLSEGFGAQGPYDIIYIDGAVEEVPETLLSQLGPNGRLVAIVQKNHAGKAVLFMRCADGSFSSREEFDASVPELPGFKAKKGFVF
ncbi:MAG: protein-L-isoaspartate O-methyltransferase [Parvibaculaceae bacterium]|nr:protein-L-isoaspartate O-methyltransferase [Parvibaculaceae bacterium]